MRTKKFFLLTAALLTALLLIGLTACVNREDPVDTEAPTVATTEPATDAPTEPEETQAATDAPEETEAPATESETEPAETAEPAASETVAEEETEEPDPCLVPVAVGKSFDGKTTCYDGRLWHEYETFTTSLGAYESIQDAVDGLEGMGGNISVTSYGDVGLCLSVNIPKDGNFYRVYYNYNNCDFVFNFGYTFDDGEGGYAYYSDLARLDSIEGLDGYHVYCWSDYDELEPGYYLMTWVGDGQVGLDRNYMYEKVGELEDTWPGLPFGETYWD